MKIILLIIGVLFSSIAYAETYQKIDDKNVKITQTIQTEAVFTIDDLQNIKSRLESNKQKLQDEIEKMDTYIQEAKSLGIN